MTDSSNPVSSKLESSLVERGNPNADAYPIIEVTHPKLFTRQDICRIFNISIRTTHYWIKSGLLPNPMQIGGKRYWQMHQLNEALMAHGGKAIHQPESNLVTTAVPGYLDGSKNLSESIKVPRSKVVKRDLIAKVVRNDSACERVKRRLGLI